MTYQLFEQVSHYRPVAATRSKLTLRRASSTIGLLSAVRGWLGASFRRQTVRPNSPDLPIRPDWDRQLRHDVLRIEARRIL